MSFLTGTTNTRNANFSQRKNIFRWPKLSKSSSTAFLGVWSLLEIIYSSILSNRIASWNMTGEKVYYVSWISRLPWFIINYSWRWLFHMFLEFLQFFVFILIELTVFSIIIDYVILTLRYFFFFFKIWDFFLVLQISNATFSKNCDAISIYLMLKIA